MKLLPVIKNRLSVPPASSTPETHGPVIIDVKAKVIKDKNQEIAGGIYVSLGQILSFGAIVFALGFVLALSTIRVTANVSSLLVVALGVMMLLIGFLVGRVTK